MKKIVTTLKKLNSSEPGQALAETAITIMLFLIIILGIIQLSMIMNAKLLVNYAAYCATRAGIVHNGNMEKMHQAAAVALAPLFTRSSSPTKLTIGYSKALLATKYGQFRMGWLVGGIKVEIVSPHPGRFESGYNKRFFPTLHSTFNGNRTEDLKVLNENLLVVKVTYWYPLEIPLINKILSPFSKQPRAKIASVCQMRMQSDNLFH